MNGIVNPLIDDPPSSLLHREQLNLIKDAARLRGSTRVRVTRGHVRHTIIARVLSEAPTQDLRSARARGGLRVVRTGCLTLPSSERLCPAASAAAAPKALKQEKQRQL